jgi:cysteine desulfuration protein SufE
MPLPPNLQAIVDDFAEMTREDKIETLIGYSESLPALPDWLKEQRQKMEPVPECMTPVFLFSEKQPDGGLVFHFDIPREAPTVRGLAALLSSGLNGSQPEEILAVPADFYLPMKLEEAISQQRMNGFGGILAHMRQAAVKALEKN